MYAWVCVGFRCSPCSFTFNTSCCIICAAGKAGTFENALRLILAVAEYALTLASSQALYQRDQACANEAARCVSRFHASVCGGVVVIVPQAYSGNTSCLLPGLLFTSFRS